MKRTSIQWELDLTKCQGTWEIGLLYRRFVISKFFFIHFTITGLRNMVRYTEIFVIKRIVKSRFHCITNPRYNKTISQVPWHFVKSRFHCITNPRYKKPISQVPSHLVKSSFHCTGVNFLRANFCLISECDPQNKDA